MAEPLLELDGHRDLLRPQPGAVRRLARHRAGRDGDADGPQRHGQDHDRALDHGADAGDGRLDPLRRRARSASLPSYRVAQLGIGLVPEGRQVFPNLTVRENLVATAANRAGAAEPWTLDKVCALFPRLAERLDSMGNLLSGGEQQMLAIGRALMTNPRLLILDEATEGLAPLIRAEIWRCLTRLKAAGPVDPGDRQERRGADPHRRPPLPDRARPGGVDRHLGRARRGAGRAAPVSGHLSLLKIGTSRSIARRYIEPRWWRSPTKAFSTSAICGLNTAWSGRGRTGADPDLLHQGLGSAGKWGDFPEKLAAATGCGVFAWSRVGYGHSSPRSCPASSISCTSRRARYCRACSTPSASSGAS